MWYAVLLGFITLGIHSVTAYRTQCFALTDTTPTLGFTNTVDVCSVRDGASHVSMPTSASQQEETYSTAKTISSTFSIPLGGGAQQAMCTNVQCSWVWNRGLYKNYAKVFFKGAYYEGKFRGDMSVDYSNFRTGYPQSWSNASYWGARVVTLQSDGTWINTNVAINYEKWVCEYYIYVHSDVDNSVVPSYPNGNPVPVSIGSDMAYSYCGSPITYDSQGRWVYADCNALAIPWWASLVIAVTVYVVIVLLIITIWCCCCKKRRNYEEKQRCTAIEHQTDNQGNIRSQREMESGLIGSFSTRSAESYSPHTSNRSFSG